MKTVKISDVTLRQYSLNKDSELSFKEKLEIIKSLDKLNIDTIELPAINDEKADVLKMCIRDRSAVLSAPEEAS